ncbi:bifunctional glutamate N-acetyltransferase/amino-acid acetyltransferase ArgJ [Brochothrix campestris]|uniref:Arginine biosynthesis bifunctional protein ArgJ n=1 Tax=Brochothrix campestris FSL F6-1037 TaxID=1265861 RepID=W7CYG9_9LIST|nr:bifunctional glutamate N-acetyltransferase/amino-acid acetyltransferase ArgJ [Brochothrix campestris]EUJ41795.1 bifunctional ornithine acetyltransferase/N-acetylglutamate synthase protein [Brochothrix campestris FSL F6-1037]
MQIRHEGHIATPLGFYTDGLHAGLKRFKKDIGLIYSDVPAQTAAVYTQNYFKGAPITVTQASLATSSLTQALIVNSGNANTCTGKKGIADAYAMRAATAAKLQLPVDYVTVASTGVIGVPLNLPRVLDGIAQLDETQSNGHGFQEAILTTDKAVKSVCVTIELDGQTVTVAGVAKGSGMINPNMATLLGFITTDAAIEGVYLDKLLRQTIERSFNQITIDGDTSTNDMVLVMANGRAGNDILCANHPQILQFKAALMYVCEQLSKKVAADGEGATKLIEVNVTGALQQTDARLIAKKVVGSNLVKAAFFGEDGNWGRIIDAIGYAGVPINPDTVDIAISGVTVLKNSEPVIIDEARDLTPVLKAHDITIAVELHLGNEAGTAWGCDLSYEYVKINAAYRT